MPELILAIDVGTTSTRAAVVAPDGTLVGLAAAAILSRNPAPGLVEQDAGRVWAATRRVIAAALAASGRRATDLAAIGVTTQRASLVVWDRRTGAPLAPMVVWSDLRGAARAGALQKAGYLVAPQQSATKLGPVIAGVDAPAERIAWGNVDSYVIWKLSGGAVHATDRSQAWPSGYLNLPDLTWNESLIAHQGLDPRTFPALVDSWGDLGSADPKVLGAAVPITADLADQQAALIAHGRAAGTTKITFGTMAAVNVATAGFTFVGPTAPPLLVSSVGGDTRWCVEGMVLSAGSALDWLRATFGLGGHDRFEALARSVFDAGGAAFLPALNGLGAPHGESGRRAALRGLSGAVTRAHVARAGLEGLAFRAREALEHIEGLTGGARDGPVGVDGGLSRSGLFLQTLADSLGRPVHRHATPEATLLGAAMGAGLGAGTLTESDIADLARFDPPVAPTTNPDDAAARFAAWAAAVHG